MWRYGPENSAPTQSSEYRELDIVLQGLDTWGELWRGGRVLNRSDNSTAVAGVNRKGTVSTNLRALRKRTDAGVTKWTWHPSISTEGSNGLTDSPGSKKQRITETGYLVTEHSNFMPLNKEAFRRVFHVGQRCK